ncbi:endo-1,4-beta-xylanase [uncultured Bacteroides sp.]|uniref:endo-1,4-beta-xylanase n=1 Tax=uncultured Bacteroides sp. TaxID=162156 RepID=UPI002AA66347|nr:endo-1,4-beta-xylanase [uncultured Bacteroides sp.]
MKYIKIIPIIIFLAAIITSCDDEKMNWHKDPTHGEIASSELPLGLQEAISRYEPLKSYLSNANFKLGCGIDLNEYTSNDAYNQLVNENFNEITIGYAMKHAAVVKADGSLDFTNIDNLFAKTNAAGLSVFGHTLVWHQNQNAAYLNGLIAPTVIPGDAGSNSLDLAGLQDGSFSGWSRNNQGAGITVEDNKGLSNADKALVMISSSTSSNAWDLQIATPDIPVVSGHTYEVSFYIKSDKAGKGRISFSGLTNGYPWIKWYADSESASEAFETTSTWKQVVFTLNENDDAFTGNSFKMNFDFGYLPDVTYSIDVNNIKVVDKDATPAVVNLISNGDFEKGNLDGWGGWGNGSTRDVSAEGEGYGNKGYAMVLTNPAAASNYNAQQVYTFDTPLEQDADYTLTFMVKANTTAALQVEIQSADNSANYYGGISVGTTWTQVEKTITPSTADRTKLLFDFGETACTFYIDNIVLSKNVTTKSRALTRAAIVIEKTDEEKTQIIGDAMTDWISKMVTHCKENVKAWDVVNEPMRESGELRDGSESTGDDVFSWIKYLGKDYAVTAFKLARQYGNGDTDKLFINDYNLETNEAKLAGLIEYVNYIESKGAKVDGIGTQMHLSLSGKDDSGIATLKGQIDKMFQTLAATGKLIKVSEFDVALGTSSPTDVQYAAQSDIYRYVVDSYKKYIPEVQQYGITVWSVSDAAEEHENWLPDDAPCLWDADYARKYAYKGFADGLAGKDVSEDFSGELQY